MQLKEEWKRYQIAHPDLDFDPSRMLLMVGCHEAESDKEELSRRPGFRVLGTVASLQEQENEDMIEVVVCWQGETQAQRDTWLRSLLNASPATVLVHTSFESSLDRSMGLTLDSKQMPVLGEKATKKEISFSSLSLSPERSRTLDATEEDKNRQARLLHRQRRQALNRPHREEDEAGTK